MSAFNMREKLADWRKLDNAAKIFPSTANRRNTRVFRFSCELNEDVVPEMLQSAASRALELFPSFRCVMRKGVFWYYFEDCSLEPVVCDDKKIVCSRMYNPDIPSLMFEVTYFHNRINLEVFHALSDGTGTLQFLKTLVLIYLSIRHPEEIKQLPSLDFTASATEQSRDAFAKYYSPTKKEKKKKHRAFRISGKKREAGDLLVIEGEVSAKSAVDCAHRYNTSLTVLLTAIYIKAIYRQMSYLQRRQPIIIMVPVNLRNFFPSETAGNFFGMISVNYDFTKGTGELEDIIKRVDHTFKHELTAERLSIRMNNLASIEHNLAARIAPLFFKNFVLSTARRISDKSETAVISNVGKIVLPTEFEPFIRKFGVYTSTEKLQLCLCSFKDNLSLCFTSNYYDTEIQREFFTSLVEMGIDVTISSNDFFEQEAE